MEKKVVPFLASILSCQLAGLLGAFFTSSAIPVWYNTLNKPSFNPPSWVFGPVWTFLYLLMGISLFLVWTNNAKSTNKRPALLLFALQLFLNAIWSPIFFGLRSPFMAFLVILVLWASILATTLQFYKLSKTAAGLLLPYFFWVSFATVLNFSIWQLNS